MDMKLWPTCHNGNGNVGKLRSRCPKLSVKGGPSRYAKIQGGSSRGTRETWVPGVFLGLPRGTRGRWSFSLALITIMVLALKQSMVIERRCITRDELTSGRGGNLVDFDPMIVEEVMGYLVTIS
ncbi:hypothetical protein L1987_81942 [Smallanthus sonchifolius]|uniref:Uncharacterized protein n=1 Tax=Smallanthus sonchifolius TaxID=185202 RepID=A0ACB8YSJ8_9ASTR|nr:hypothetical protein L1987_81942 [Smallanthus sonchifolius]